MKTHLLAEAQVLRRRGLSLQQLSERFGISKSTASLWTKDVELSDLGIDRLRSRSADFREKGHATLRKRKNDRIDQAQIEADELCKTIQVSKSSELVILSILYQCEGNKDLGDGVRFTNSDPDTVRLFLATLRKSFLIDESRLRVRIHIHDYHDDIQLKQFWSTVTKIPINQFYKSFQKPSNHTYKKEGYMGCAHVLYYDAQMARVISMVAKNLSKLYI